jgi:predicted nucleic acid-binding protein
MTQFLLDTSVIIDILNGKHNRAQLIRKLLAEGNTCCCCSINIAEVYAGMRPKEKLRTDAFLDNLYCYDITRTIAVRAGALRYHWSQRGTTLSTSDTIIAGTVLTHNLTLMTDNLKHYPMPELKKFEDF